MKGEEELSWRYFIAFAYIDKTRDHGVANCVLDVEYEINNTEGLRELESYICMVCDYEVASISNFKLLDKVTK